MRNLLCSPRGTAPSSALHAQRSPRGTRAAPGPASPAGGPRGKPSGRSQGVTRPGTRNQAPCRRGPCCGCRMSRRPGAHRTERWPRSRSRKPEQWQGQRQQEGGAGPY